MLKLSGMESIDLVGVEAVFFALKGSVVLSGQDGAVHLQAGDAAVARLEQGMSIAGNAATLFVGVLLRF